MKKEIGWVEKLPEGKREISAKVFGGKVYWAWRMSGTPEWDESAEPEEHHWEELEQLYRNRLNRGIGTKDGLACVVARIKGEVRGRPRQSEPLPSKKPGNVI